MQHLKKYIILLIIFTLSAGGVYASNKVLIISSYGTDYQWANSIIDGINIELKKSYPDVELNIAYLSSERSSDTQQWIDKIDTLLSGYRDHPPRAIVLISDEAWMAYNAADNEPFRQVPLLLCAVKPHSICIKNYNTYYDAMRLENFCKTEDMLKGYNATGIIREMNVSGYIELMVNAIPDLNRFVLITDNRFYGIYTRLLFEQEVRSKYPDYPVEYIDARFVNTDSLFRKLPSVTKNTGVLLTSWLTGEHGFTYSKNYVYKQITAGLKTPVFITNDIGMDKGWFIGGYFNRSSALGEKMGLMLVDVLKGVSPSDIPIQVYNDDQCNINYEVMKTFNLSAKNFPKDTIYSNSPVSLFERYKTQIILILILFIIIIFTAIYILKNNIKLQKAKKELLNAKESLTEALENAKAADALKSSFVANMGNQIRNPLNAIVGFSNIICDMEDPTERKKTAQLLKQNSDNLFELITSILDISQLESKSVTFYKEEINLNALCSDLINAQRAVCPPETTLKFNPPAQPMTIVTDPLRLTQALLNLIGNAIKFTEKGTIEVGYFAYDDEHVEFYVQDTGIGIEPHNLGTVFDSFVKINPYTTGTGLGLTIAKNIVEIFGGEIGVSSTFGEGSRFWFRIKIF